ncbi:MAG: hypothetical protein H6748_08315 [Spirochaetaceae bacterium]|nr:hypothetical protein [Spirochaetaceae bacterium]
MSKLWIVHRRPEMRAALARASGLPGTEIVAGAPLPGEAFAEARSPAAILIALEDDFEQELEFAHRERERLRHARWIVLCDRSDAEEASRLFDLDRPEILTHPLDPRALRAEIARARGARRVESLAQREQRERVAARFSAWLGGLEVPGLLRALDPALASLPLLVRGAAGSGRALLARYVELFRGARGRILRLDARSLDDVQALPERLAEAGPGLATLWLDEVDALSAADQRTLAEWIRHDAPPAAPGLSGLRWVATAGADDLYATLEPALERAFAPLVLAVPAIAAHPETLGRFAEAVATEWTRSVGGPARHFAPEAIEALSRLRWAGDRAELEAVLRSSLAAAARERVEASDLRFPTGEPLPAGHPVAQTGPETTAEATAAPEPIETAIMEPASEAELEGLAIVDAEEEEAIDRAFDQALDPSWTHAAGSTADAAEPAPAPTPEPTAAAADRAALEQAYAEGAQAGPDDLRANAAETDASAAPPDDFDESARLAASALEAAGADDLGAALADDGLAAAAGSGASSAPASDADAPGAGAGAGTSPSTPPAPAPTPSDLGWRRLARSLSHEIRNPLVSIRTFAELLPEHFEDETFRTRFTDLVGKDVRHIDEVLSRLSSVAEHDRVELVPVDISVMLEQLLDERRERIGRRRLLVLRELEREAPFALADGHALRVALAGLLDRALESLPERGDLFVATRFVERSADGTPRLRVLLRHHNPDLARDTATAFAELDPTANLIEYVLAETVVEASGGRLTIDATDALETVILVDLRTPD